MPCTEKQLAANRLNAQRSTGPKTEAGKRRSSQNARKHGFTSRKFDVHAMLDRNAFTDQVVALCKEWRPRSEAELGIIGAIAARFVLSFSLVEAETRILRERIKKTGTTNGSFDVLSRISLAEARLNRELDELFEKHVRQRSRLQRTQQ